MALSLDYTKTHRQTTNQAKKICEDIRLTRKTWDQQETKTQEGKIFRGRPQRFKLEEEASTQETLGLKGNRCLLATRNSPGSAHSTAQLAAKQSHGDQQTTVLQHGNSADEYIPKSDEILVELHKILVFRDKDPFINAVCAKRRSKPKVNEKKISRERRAEVKNAYFRKTSMTAGERALDEGKAANSSKACAKSRGKIGLETSTEIGEESETKSVQLSNKECSQKPVK